MGKYFSYDIYLETGEGEKLGFEILARPTMGKMKRKLIYMDNLDKFVFILPSNSLQFYLKQVKYALSNIRPHYFDKSFCLDNLYAWIYDVNSRKISKKDLFCRIFNVAKPNSVNRHK